MLKNVPETATRARRSLDLLPSRVVDAALERHGDGTALLTLEEAYAESGRFVVVDPRNTRLGRYLGGDTDLTLRAGPGIRPVPGIENANDDRLKNARIDAYVFDERFGSEMHGPYTHARFREVEDVRRGFERHVADQIERVKDMVDLAGRYAEGLQGADLPNQNQASRPVNILAAALIEEVVPRVLQEVDGRPPESFDGVDLFNATGRRMAKAVFDCTVDLTLKNGGTATAAQVRGAATSCLVKLASAGTDIIEQAIRANAADWPAGGAIVASAAVAADVAQVYLSCFNAVRTNQVLSCANSALSQAYSYIAVTFNEANAALDADRIVEDLIVARASYHLAELEAKGLSSCPSLTWNGSRLSDHGCTNDNRAKAAYCEIADSIGANRWRCHLRGPGWAYFSSSKLATITGRARAHVAEFERVRRALVTSEEFARTQCGLNRLSCLPARAEITRVGYEPSGGGWTMDIAARLSNTSGYALSVAPRTVRLVSLGGRLLHEAAVPRRDVGTAYDSLPGRGGRNVEVRVAVPVPSTDALLQVEFDTVGPNGGTVVGTAGFRVPTATPPVAAPVTPVTPAAPVAVPDYEVALETVRHFVRPDGRVNIGLRAVSTVDGRSAAPNGATYRFRVFGPNERMRSSRRLVAVTGTVAEAPGVRGTRIRVDLLDANSRVLDSATYTVRRSPRVLAPRS